MHTDDSPSLMANPQLERWIRFVDNERVRIATGKVEIGQGIVTALAQIAADELDVSLSQVAMLPGNSPQGPDERYTTSSLSVQESGTAIRLVCAGVRQRLLARAAQRLNCAVDELSVVDGQIVKDGVPTGYNYWRIAPEVDLESPLQGEIATKAVADYRIVGTSVPRLDLRAKITGAAFIHDYEPPSLVHARTLRQPARGSRLVGLDEAGIKRAAAAPVDIVRVGDFVAFLSADEAVAERAAVAGQSLATWSNVPELEAGVDEAKWLLEADAELTLFEPQTAESAGTPGARPASRHGTVRRAYSRGYVAHASMGPSCALAKFEQGQLTVWSHGQGMHPLQRTLADALDLPVAQIATHHLQGPGCYGHNGADDAALDAALIARERPGSCIRVQWRREEEFGFEPVGPSMHVALAVDIDENGNPIDWDTTIHSGVHVQRPGLGGGNLLASEALPNPAAAPIVADPPEARGGGGTRNAVPAYRVGAHRIHHHLVPRTPIRTSALRGLGALPNVYAIESMMDELASQAGRDPLEYRLALLTDPRAKDVLRQVAELSNWQQRTQAEDGYGMGLAFARYKNSAAYAAVAARVHVDEAVTVSHIW